MSTKNSSDSVRISAKEKMKAAMWTNRGGEHSFYISKMHDEKSNTDGTKNSSQAPEDCFVRISGKEKMKANAVMNKDCIVRISAEEKMKSDSVFRRLNPNMTKDCLKKKKKRKSSYKDENEENCQAEQLDEAPKKKKKKIMPIWQGGPSPFTAGQKI